jgi:CheY-like chemotaxis protein
MTLPLVLYVEDDQQNFDVAELRLGRRFRLLHAIDDRRACQLLELHRLELVAVLMDIELKGSKLDGLMLTRLMRGKSLAYLPDYAQAVSARETPVFIVTAYEAEYAATVISEVGANNAFTKPVDFLKLSLALSAAYSQAVMTTLSRTKGPTP